MKSIFREHYETPERPEKPTVDAIMKLLLKEDRFPGIATKVRRGMGAPEYANVESGFVNVTFYVVFVGF